MDNVGSDFVEVVVADLRAVVLLDGFVDASEELFNFCLLVDIHLETANIII